jgi:hypothetical protein
MAPQSRNLLPDVSTLWGLATRRDAAVATGAPLPDRNPGVAGIGRRALLRVLALASTWAVAAVSWRADAALSVSDRRLAALGGRLRASDPARARELVGLVEGRLRWVPVHLTAGTRAALVRTWLLDPVRIRREFAADDVVAVDGWILSRTEVAVCAYLDALAAPRGAGA